MAPGFHPALPSLINPSPCSLSLLQSGGLYLGASCAPIPFCLLVLIQGSWSCLRTTPLWSWQDPTGPCESGGALDPQFPREDRESCQTERRQRVWFSYRLRLRALPKLNGYLQLLNGYLQVFNYKPTAINLQLVNFWR